MVISTIDAIIDIVFVRQEHLVGEGAEDTKHEMARHFELCDSDGDGYLTFSQFLRWVELCDLNPEDHLQVGAVPCHALVKTEVACAARNATLRRNVHGSKDETRMKCAWKDASMDLLGKPRPIRGRIMCPCSRAVRLAACEVNMCYTCLCKKTRKR